MTERPTVQVTQPIIIARQGVTPFLLSKVLNAASRPLDLKTGFHTRNPGWTSPELETPGVSHHRTQGVPWLVSLPLAFPSQAGPSQANFSASPGGSHHLQDSEPNYGPRTIEHGLHLLINRHNLRTHRVRPTRGPQRAPLRDQSASLAHRRD